MSQQHSGGSPWSETASVQLATDYMPPAAPSNLSATERTEMIELTWDNPTENKDGSTLYDHVDEHCKVHYSTSSGIDINDSSTYDGVIPDVYGARKKFDSEQTSTTFYFVVTAVDREGNESQASSEVSASPKPVTIDPDLNDFSDNFESDPIIGDGQIGIVFKQPDATWSGFSRYKLYYDEDDGSGFTGTWTKVYEGAESYYRHTFLDSTHYYKYKLAFIDEDGNETSGTIKDNGGTGWQPNNSDNSNLVSEPFFAGIIVADEEVRSQHIQVGSLSAIQKLTGNIGTAESGARVEIFPDSDTGIQVIDDGGNDVFLAKVGGTNVGDVVMGDLAGEHIQWDKSAGKMNVKGGITILGGSGISNLTDAGDLAEKDAALVSNGDVVIDGDLTIQSGGEIITDGGDVRLGTGVLSGGGDGLRIKNGGGVEISDADGTVIFDSNNRFRAGPVFLEQIEDTNTGSILDITFSNLDTNYDYDVYEMYVEVHSQASGTYNKILMQLSGQNSDYKQFFRAWEEQWGPRSSAIIGRCLDESEKSGYVWVKGKNTASQKAKHQAPMWTNDMGNYLEKFGHSSGIRLAGTLPVTSIRIFTEHNATGIVYLYGKKHGKF